MATIKSTIELVDKMSATLSNIEKNVDNLKKSLGGISDKQSDIDSFSWDTFIQNADKAASEMQRIGAEMSLAITAPLVKLGKKMYGNSVEYESAYVGMTKTVEGTEEQYEHLSELAKELSETTPMGYVDLMGIMQTGGNLGVGVDEMENFVKSYAQLQYATDQHIAGENGAQDVASFLNIIEGGVQNIDKFGAAIVHLGNNYNATEDQIVHMGNRMAAAANLAGMSTPDVLGMATAFTAVGINAEAGGSAASKLIKQLQMATEVGGQAQNALSAAGFNYDSALDFVNSLSSMKNADIVNIADQMGMTKDSLERMGDSWLMLEQFATVSGRTVDQFVKDWGTDAVGAMGAFFTGLNSLGDDGTESILATLDKMGLTEIRESNLIAAMASRPELFTGAVAAATQAYFDNVAMLEEFNKQMETQESQNAMLENKFDNTMQNLGDNLVEALQPALKMANDILDAFNNLSETDQTALIEALGFIALVGPGLTIAGTALKGIAGAMKLINSLGGGAGEAVEKVAGAASKLSPDAGSWLTSAKNWIAEKASGIDLAGMWNGAFVVDWFTHNTDVGRAVTGAETWNDVGNAFEQWQIQLDENAKNFSRDWGNLWKQITGQPIEEVPKVSIEPEIEVPDDIQSTIEELIHGGKLVDKETKLKLLIEGIDVPETAMLTAGENVDAGLGMGIGENSYLASEAGTNMAQETVDAINGALGVQSPSVIMMETGMYLDEGIMMGIQQGQPMIVSATMAMANGTLNTARSILSPAAGSGIGSMFGAGLAEGIASSIPMVTAAARRLASAALSAVSSILKIHSPSRETYWQGEMTVLGFTNALEDGIYPINRTIGKVIDSTQGIWNQGIWNTIGQFAAIETKAWQDEMDGVEDKVKISDSDIKKIRSLAEREVINHFTTAEIKVEMNNTNTITNSMDIDGVISQLEDRLTERLEAVAEGVYN